MHDLHVLDMTGFGLCYVNQHVFRILSYSLSACFIALSSCCYHCVSHN
jgi:hypothetical protein